jgi:hypothetical protein
MTINACQRELGIAGHVGEIGVHHGKLFILLYLLADGTENALAIDIFGAQDLNVDNSGKGDLAVLTHNLKSYAGETARLKIISGDSTTLTGEDLTGAAGGKLRLLSIDGGHLARIVRHDLNTAATSLGEGGVVILDDFFNPEFPGVGEGTNQFFLFDNGRAGEKLAPFLIGMNKVYLTTEAYASRYIDHFCRKDLGRPFASTIKFNTYAARHHAVFVTELFGATVLAYSPDRFSLGYRLGRSLKAKARKIRGSLGDTRLGRHLRNSRLGGLIAQLANRIAPY